MSPVPGPSGNVCVAREAMATRFEIVLPGADAARLRAAAEEALAEVEALEERLSFHRATSEVSRLNALASQAPVKVSAELFQLLQTSLRHSEATHGAFDITIAPLLRCWGFVRGSGHVPTEPDLQRARESTGFRWIALDAERQEVRFLAPGVQIDLGSIGKGHAIDVAVGILRDAGVENALVHGGTSTAYGLGVQADGTPWTIALELPAMTPGETGRLLGTVPLRDEAISVSAVWGKAFRSGDRLLGHVLDPRTGQPASKALMSAVVAPTAAESDALSTALLVSGPAGWTAGGMADPRLKALVVPCHPDGSPATPVGWRITPR